MHSALCLDLQRQQIRCMRQNRHTRMGSLAAQGFIDAPLNAGGMGVPELLFVVGRYPR